MKIVLDIAPPKGTAQQKGERVVVPKNGGKPFVHHYKKNVIQSQESTLVGLLKDHAPDEPIEGPITIGITAVWPYRKTEKKSVTKIGAYVPKVTGADWDNFPKALCDVMTTLGFWRDDVLIYGASVWKFWGPKGRIEIDINSQPKPIIK